MGRYSQSLEYRRYGCFPQDDTLGTKQGSQLDLAGEWRCGGSPMRDLMLTTY